MKLQSKYIIGLVLMGTLFSACEKEVKLKESDITPRLVVNSIFEANDTLRVHLSESRDILFNNGGDLPNITGATATLLNSNDAVLGTFIHEGEGIYYLPGFYPKAGEQYKFKASYTGFNDVSSSNVIPQVISINKLDTSSQLDYMDFSATFSDNPNEKNYYAMSVIAKSTYTYEVEPGVFVTETFEESSICSKDINIKGASADPDGEICGEELLFGDDLFNGTDYTFKFKKYLYETPDTLIISLRSISEDLFKYKISLQKYQETSGNPFGEPVQVFSNIEDGFGIFAGSSLYRDTIVF